MFGLFGKKKVAVVFHMKSGNKIKFRCENFTCKHDGEKLTSYTATAMDSANGDPIFWVSLAEIESVSLEK